MLVFLHHFCSSPELTREKGRVHCVCQVAFSMRHHLPLSPGWQVQLGCNLFLVWKAGGGMCSCLQLLWATFSLGSSHYQVSQIVSMELQGDFQSWWGLFCTFQNP